MTSHRVTLIPGDGIGPEVIDAACAVVDSTGVRVEWERHQIGLPALEAGASTPLPGGVIESIRRNRVALKGPVTTGLGGFRSPNIELRRALELHTQVRPVRSMRGTAARYENVDLVVARETSEDLYSGVELAPGSADAMELVGWLQARGFELPTASGLSIKHVSAAAVDRMVQRVAAWATENGRRRITLVHKAAVMRATDGLFLDVARARFAEYPTLTVDDASVDLVAMRLVRSPSAFDVLVTLNLYGDVLSDLAAGLTGGVGLAPGANFGDELAVFEPAHGSAPKYAGQDRADPIAAVLSAALMLRHLGEGAAADRVEAAVAAVLASGTVRTQDLVGEEGTPASGTRAMTSAITEQLG